MYKIKLPQPYASMVVSGVMKTLPIPFFDDIAIGQKIFIYATEYLEGFIDQIDYSLPKYRKLHNEIFLGNIPNDVEKYPTNQFVGYVIVSKERELDGWDYDGIGTKIFVNNAHRFTKRIENYSMSLSSLESVSATLVKPRKMRLRRKDMRLIVQVGESTWNDLHDSEELPYISMFWEDYMAKYVPSLYTFFQDYEDEIEVHDIQFQYGDECMNFESIDGCCGSPARPKGWTENVDLLYFRLDYQIGGPQNFVDIDSVKDSDLRKRRHKKIKFEDEDGSEKAPYVKMISTPMGGQNKWKR